MTINKFDSLFLSQARRLVDAFPLDSKLADGSLFWQSPKRPPIPLVFDVQNAMHLDFVCATARLLAAVYDVAVQVSCLFFVCGESVNAIAFALPSKMRCL